MYHRVRKKMTSIIISALVLLIHPLSILSKSIETTTVVTIPDDDGFDNNIIDFDEEYSVIFNKKYGMVPWHANDFNKNTHRYNIIRDMNKDYGRDISYANNTKVSEETTTQDYRVIPLELLSTTEDPLVSIFESTTEPDLTVIPLSTTKKIPNVKIDETVTLPSTTEYDSPEMFDTETTTQFIESDISTITSVHKNITTARPVTLSFKNQSATTVNATNEANVDSKEEYKSVTVTNITDTKLETNNTKEGKEYDPDVPVFTELDTENFENIPEDYYDSKDVVPTSAPKTDAVSVLFGLAGSVVESVVESVAERVVPKSIFDLFKRMQRQNEALEAERLRSREENGGLGQFGRGILKSLSTGLSKPLSQLMAGVKEVGSLDTDRGFVGNVASSVSSVANAAGGVLDAFKDKVQAIYPGTVWCGDGHSAQARSSSDLGLFFFTDTCCRQHDACKIYINAGETKYGLTNTGLFTRSHCSCDTKFRECLRRTNSLVSAQIGLTYFNVLGPQCFRKAHPIVKCLRKTRITGQKCEEYELDYTKSKMWQWFDNETF